MARHVHHAHPNGPDGCFCAALGGGAGGRRRSSRGLYLLNHVFVGRRTVGGQVFRVRRQHAVLVRGGGRFRVGDDFRLSRLHVVHFGRRAVGFDYRRAGWTRRRDDSFRGRRQYRSVAAHRVDCSRVAESLVESGGRAVHVQLEPTERRDCGNGWSAVCRAIDARGLFVVRLDQRFLAHNFLGAERKRQRNSRADRRCQRRRRACRDDERRGTDLHGDAGCGVRTGATSLANAAPSTASATTSEAARWPGGGFRRHGLAGVGPLSRD